MLIPVSEIGGFIHAVCDNIDSDDLLDLDVILYDRDHILFSALESRNDYESTIMKLVLFFDEYLYCCKIEKLFGLSQSYKTQVVL